MITFTKKMQCAAQGDVYMRRVSKLPDGCTKAVAVDGKYILAHSETGHHHVVAERPNVIFHTTADPMVSYLEVIEATDEAETVLEHLRSFDTHEPFKLEPGIIEIRTGREETPQGWRRVQD